MKELQAKAKVTQTMTRDGLVVENQADGTVENVSSREAEQDYSTDAEGKAEKILERAEDIKDGHKNKKKAKKAAETAATAESEDGLHRSAARLELTEEERADPALQPYIQKAEAKADKLDAARAALPKKRVPVKEKVYDDPYVLISILSALHDGVFTLAEVQGELEMLFEKQYILTETVTMQIRYRTKMMVIIGPYGVPQVITYQEPYEYYICTVKLKNKDLSHLPVEVLTEEQLSAYSLYMRTLGNRPDLFGKAQYPNASTIKQPTYYDIPPEALKDDRFAAMMEEATKYIGYPYVWGGSSPSTSFDCSGYISWVLNHSGWNVGRQTAQGLYNLCTPVSTAQVKPGDLVFFKGTYDTPGVSHCGIYVGNSIMLHCGDPISYTNLNSKYWQEHFYSYGRLP